MITFEKTKKPRFIKIKSPQFIPLVIKEIECPICGLDKIKKLGSKWIGVCGTCNHIHNFLVPTPVQSLLIQLRARIMNFIGGTGSGKTTASANIIAESMRNHPGVKVVAFAQTFAQLDETAKAELDKLFVGSDFIVKNETRWKLKNGSQIKWYSSDSEQKIRGMNIGIAWLVESSGLKYEIFTQLMTRTRQDEMKVFLNDKDGNPLFYYDEQEKRPAAIVLSEKGILINETNPTYEWPRDKALFKSHTILYTESVRGMDKVAPFVKPQVDPEIETEILDMISVLFASTDNPMMTTEYLSTIRTTYPSKEEYERDIYCDMSYATGLIYGAYAETMFQPQGETWVDGKLVTFGEALDPGGAAKGNDESAYGMFRNIKAKSPRELPDITLIDGYKISGLSTYEEAKEIWKVRNKYKWQHELNDFSVIDPHGVKNEKKTKSNMLKDLRVHDVFFTKEGVNDEPDWGIKRVLMFLKAGKLHIADNEFGQQVKDEIATYIWTTKMSTTRAGKKVQKPLDKNNHIMDMIRFYITRVPITPQAQSEYSDESVNFRKREYSASSLDHYDRKYQIEDGEESENKVDGTGGVYLEF